MEAMTIKAFEKKLYVERYHGEEGWIKLPLYSFRKLKKAIQISDNCQALLKKWEEGERGLYNGVVYGTAGTCAQFSDCLAQLKQAIGKEK